MGRGIEGCSPRVRIILRLERGATDGPATVDRDGRNLRKPSDFGTDQPSYIEWERERDAPAIRFDDPSPRA